MSITRRVCGVTSTNVPRVQWSVPIGERMQTSNAPPMRISTVASGTVKVAGLNQRLTCSAELQARNTVSRRAWKMRDRRSGGGWMAASVLVSWGIVGSFVCQGVQVVAQAVEPVLPLDPAGVDPLLGLAERLRLDGAGAD